MTKTQVYFRADELKALHRIARARKRPVAELVREAVRAMWLRPEACWPVGLWGGPLRRGKGSADHDSAFDVP
ncbi:MAG TPA: CopG family transcriptional regulator [Myxococcales bacterium]|nr:CopG family transcriptional regulator [Myxococcales bacterium]